MAAHSLRNASAADLKSQNTTQRLLNVALNVHIVKTRVECIAALLVGGAVLIHNYAIDLHGGVLQALHFVVGRPHVHRQVQRASVSSAISKSQTIDCPGHRRSVIAATGEALRPQWVYKRGVG